MSTNWDQFGFKPQLMTAINNCGFEHESEVQHECIPQAILGKDILCSAKSGMGKPTTAFVLATLQQLDPVEGQVAVLAICHSQESAEQISKEYERFSEHMPTIRVSVFADGINKTNDELDLRKKPHIVVGTPGRILALIRRKKLNLRHIKHLIVDQFDEAFKRSDMRRDIKKIFKAIPYEKQVMIFSATLSKDIRSFCRKSMKDGSIYYVEEEMIDSDYKSCTRWMSIEQAQNELKKGDVIQIWQNNIYMHTILYKDPENCYHVTRDLAQKGVWNSFRFAVSSLFGTHVYLRRHPLEEILYCGPRDRKGERINHDSNGNIIAPKYKIFRVNNQESEAISRGINVDQFKSDIDKTFASLDKLLDKKVPYKLIFKNCDSYVYGWKWGQQWSPQIQAVVYSIPIKFKLSSTQFNPNYKTTANS